MKTEQTQKVIKAVRDAMTGSMAHGKRPLHQIIEPITEQMKLASSIVAPIFSTCVTAGFIFKEKATCPCCGHIITLYYGWNTAAGDFEAFKRGNLKSKGYAKGNGVAIGVGPERKVANG